MSPLTFVLGLTALSGLATIWFWWPDRAWDDKRPALGVPTPWANRSPASPVVAALAGVVAALLAGVVVTPPAVAAAAPRWWLGTLPLVLCLRCATASVAGALSAAATRTPVLPGGGGLWTFPLERVLLARALARRSPGRPGQPWYVHASVARWLAWMSATESRWRAMRAAERMRRALDGALERTGDASEVVRYTIYRDVTGPDGKPRREPQQREYARRTARVSSTIVVDEDTSSTWAAFTLQATTAFDVRAYAAWCKVAGVATAVLGVPRDAVRWDEDRGELRVLLFAPALATAPAALPEPEPEPEPEGPAADIDTPVAAGCPPLALLAPPKRGPGRPTEGKTVAERITRALERLRKPAEVVAVAVGPGTVTVTLRPGEVVTANRDGTVKRDPVRATDVMAASRELAVALGAEAVRVYADTSHPGCVAVEVPREHREGVAFREAVAADEFRRAAKDFALPVALGRDVLGRVVVADLAAAPHILAAGTTGSGKSVALNALICSLLVVRTPAQVRLFILDPKRVDFAGYEGLPHLAAPILVEAEQGIAVLEWLVQEMERRYAVLRAAGVNNIAKLPPEKALPRIVFVADEFADLLMAAEGDGGKEGKEARAALERNIARIAQKARAAGIHLILATQRPTANVVTGLIKANMPMRLALRVNSELDSRVILDQPGAEALAGKGDALWSPGGAQPVRVQTPYADPDIPVLVGWWRENWHEPTPPLWPPAGAEQVPAPGVAGVDEAADEDVEDVEDGITL